jgi:putative DNA primase/helicase
VSKKTIPGPTPLADELVTVTRFEPEDDTAGPPNGAKKSPPNGNGGEINVDRYSEDALAMRFTRRHKDDLRYVAAWGKWYLFDGHLWRPDAKLAAFEFSRVICREAASEVRGKSKSLAAKIASARTRAAVENMTRADPAHAASVDQWDADNWLLNTPVGARDLRTGKVSAPNRKHYMTKSASVAAGGDCPRWRAFLHRITDGDQDLQAYLQRMVGYCLTGETREHVMFFCYGAGANGKSVFINTIAAALGDYAVTAPIEAFTVSGQDRHPTEIAMLRGARLVVATETEEGRRWAESRIKLLTGGDRVAARFMRQDFFEFSPQFKLAVVGNHKPQLRGVNEAIRRRLHLIPFAVTIPPRERDTDLPRKLALERAGILAWAIEGCLEWQRIGLAPPLAVQDATRKYLTDEDVLGLWLSDCCETSPRYEARTAALFGSWLDWCEKAGERAGNQKAFVEALENRGFERARIGHAQTRGFRGLRLRTMSEYAERDDEDVA